MNKAEALKWLEEGEGEMITERYTAEHLDNLEKNFTDYGGGQSQEVVLRLITELREARQLSEAEAWLRSREWVYCDLERVSGAWVVNLEWTADKLRGLETSDPDMAAAIEQARAEVEAGAAE